MHRTTIPAVVLAGLALTACSGSSWVVGEEPDPIEVDTGADVSVAVGADLGDGGLVVGNRPDDGRIGTDVSISAASGRPRLDPVVDDVVVLPDGSYELVGYGTVLIVDGDEVVPQYVTDSTCTVGEPFDNELVVDHADDDGSVITLDLVGPTTDHRLRPLADARECVGGSDDAVTALDEAFRTHYPFFDERGIDWDEAVDSIERSVGDDGSALEAALAEFVVELRDGHTTLDGVELEPDVAAFGVEGVDGADDLDGLVGRELAASIDRLVDPRVDESGTVVWGAIASDPDVGYLLLTSFLGLSGEDDELADREALVAALDVAIAELDGEVDHLVLDLRFHPGGLEDLAVLTAGYFVDEPAPAYRKWAYAEPTSTIQTVEVEPAGARFGGRVAVLTSPATASAAEVLLLTLREVADATVVGSPSFGEFSDAIDWVLPDGTELTMSMEVYTDLDGGVYEATGIPVDVPAPLDESLDAAIATLS